MNKRITAFLCAVCMFAVSLLSCSDTADGITAGKGVYVIPGETVPIHAPGTADAEIAVSDTAEEAAVTEDIADTAAEETAQPAEQLLRVLTVVSPARQNKKAKLTASGIPGETYSIAVYYSSGKSEAAGLTDKKANENGLVSWTWKVGGRTKPGTYRITVTGGGETAETEFTVTE